MSFDSVNDPIPPLRTDLEIIPYEEDAEQLLLLRDPVGYGTEMILFKPEAWALFSLFDGVQTVSELQREIFRTAEVHVDASQISDIIRMLDEYYFLQSERFHTHKAECDQEFLDLAVRPMVHAGQSYPEEPEELTAFLDAYFQNDTTALPDTAPAGILIPHIDMRIGTPVYVPPFRHLAAHDDFDTIVVFGTSHYSSEDLFIPTGKHFQTPLGILETDTEFIETLHRNTGGQFTKNDVAHKQEHSLEFPAIFLKYLFGEGKKIVPILVTSFEECIVGDTHPETLPKYTTFIEGFRNTVTELGRNVTYVLSVDWSHVGMKFGDPVAAAELLPAVRESDYMQLRALEQGNYEAFRSQLVSHANKTNIDGFSCISTFFDIVHPSSGTVLHYDQWHEEERQSGVTFAGMSFFK